MGGDDQSWTGIRQSDVNIPASIAEQAQQSRFLLRTAATETDNMDRPGSQLLRHEAKARVINANTIRIRDGRRTGLMQRQPSLRLTGTAIVKLGIDAPADQRVFQLAVPNGRGTGFRG